MASTIHANARTTPRIRREIQMAPPSVSNAALAHRYGIHRHTVAKWRKRVSTRCPPWRAKRRRVVPGSREATRDIRRAEGAKGDPKGASERGVQSYGRPVCSRNELAMLWRNAG